MEQKQIPEFFREWLDSLSAGPTDVMFEWLEDNPNASQQIHEVLFNNPT